MVACISCDCLVPPLPFFCSLPVRGPDDDVPAAARLPQDGRPARPHQLPGAAALRGTGRPPAYPGGGGGLLLLLFLLWGGCHQAVPGARLPALL